ncbi:MAG: hypothetical protein MHPSP_001647 [Paramarteilia canceri]
MVERYFMPSNILDIGYLYLHYHGYSTDESNSSSEDEFSEIINNNLLLEITDDLEKRINEEYLITEKEYKKKKEEIKNDYNVGNSLNSDVIFI